jgi:hypothetical protein
MTIAELLAATGLTENDLVPIYDVEAAQNVEPTQKITAAQFAAAVKVLADLQGKLTFDSTPTAGSTNPVTSAGIATAIQQSTAFIKKFTTKVTIPANGTATISISQYTGGQTPYGVIVKLGTYQLPYCAPAPATYISSVTTQSITITNSAGAWTNYDAYVVLFM